MAALPARQRRLGDAQKLGRMALLDAAQAAPSAQRARPYSFTADALFQRHRAPPEDARQDKVEDHDRPQGHQPNDVDAPRRHLDLNPQHHEEHRQADADEQPGEHHDHGEELQRLRLGSRVDVCGITAPA